VSGCLRGVEEVVMGGWWRREGGVYILLFEGEERMVDMEMREVGFLDECQ
jgi:hypothetical protein